MPSSTSPKNSCSSSEPVRPADRETVRLESFGAFQVGDDSFGRGHRVTPEMDPANNGCNE